MDDADRMRNCLGSSFHNEEHLTVKKSAPKVVFGTEKVIMNSIFRKDYLIGFLKRGVETQLSHITSFSRVPSPLLSRGQKGPRCNDPPSSM